MLRSTPRVGLFGGAGTCNAAVVIARAGLVSYLGVATAVAGTAAAALVGLIGEPRLVERFEAKTVVVTPGGGDGVRITEYVDIDFGTAQRRGYQREIPLDLGIPIQVEASSETAPDDLDITQIDGVARIRVGHPDQRVTGQHRYVLAYTYPDSGIATGRLDLDVIGTEEEFETERFEVVIAGFELGDRTCSTGAAGALGGCALEADGDVYRAVISPLAPGEGITITADIDSIVAVPEIVSPAAVMPRTTVDRRGLLAGAIAVIGGFGAALTRVMFGRRGSNEVAGTSAADGAFGGSGGLHERMNVRHVSDARLAGLTTTEFVPPSGLEPWEATVLLRERIDDDTVSAWFSGLAGHDVLTLVERDRSLIVSPGPQRYSARAGDAVLIDELFARGDEVVLKDYDASFAALWARVRAGQGQRIAQSGWWARYPPGPNRSWTDPLAIISVVSLLVAGAMGAAGIVGLLSGFVTALAGAVVLIVAVSIMLWSPILRSRSVEGSALTLRTESFRRFLEASEARHVEWAWDNGLVREYSGWAVALGAVGAWRRALARAQAETGIPIDAATTGPLLMASGSRYVTRAVTSPSSSGGSGSGSVGSGGGGGRSGSW